MMKPGELLSKLLGWWMAAAVVWGVSVVIAHKIMGYDNLIATVTTFVFIMFVVWAAYSAGRD